MGYWDKVVSTMISPDATTEERQKQEVLVVTLPSDVHIHMHPDFLTKLMKVTSASHLTVGAVDRRLRLCFIGVTYPPQAEVPEDL